MSDEREAEVVPAGVQSLEQMESMRRQQERALSEFSHMVKWYGKKAKRFNGLVLWDRKLPEIANRRSNIKERAVPVADDPPEMDMICKHRDHHDRLEKVILELEKTINGGGLEGKDYVNACVTLSNLSNRMLGHLKEMGVILANLSREFMSREGTMQRLAASAGQLTVSNAQHNDKIALLTNDMDPNRMSNADLQAILDKHEQRSKADAEKLEVGDAEGDSQARAG